MTTISLDQIEVANLRALNLLSRDSLGGDLKIAKTDAQSKTHGQALLRMELELPQGVALADLLPGR